MVQLIPFLKSVVPARCPERWAVLMGLGAGGAFSFSVSFCFLAADLLSVH